MEDREKGSQTNRWDVLKVLCICVAACFIANASLASDLKDFSEVKGGGLGLLMSFLGVAGAKGLKII